MRSITLSNSPLFLLTASAALLACSAEPGGSGEAIGAVQNPVVFGSDNRQEIFSLGLEGQYESDSVAITMNSSNTLDQGNGTTNLVLSNWTSVSPAEGATGTGNVCATEPFRGQPRFMYCTGFLVAPNLIATAGHCTGGPGTDITDFRYVFQFRMDGANQPRTSVATADVYPAKRVVAAVSNPGVEDWSIVELTRSVPNRRIVPMRRTGSLGANEPLFMIGHPLGLPMKYVGGGTSKANGQPQYFGFGLDLNKGNSGGPIFNATTHEAEGICSTTPSADFVLDSANNCFKSNVCSDATGCPGWAGAQRVTTAGAFVPGYSSTYLANFNGTGGADLLSVTWSGIWTRNSTGTSFPAGGFGLSTAFYGNQGTFFADVNNDGKADAIAMNAGEIVVRRSNGSAFGAAETWSSGFFYGDHGNFFADIDNDHRADAIVVNHNGITVRRAPASGSGFGSPQTWTANGYYGTRGTYFADIDVDGRADAIVVNENGVTVRRAPTSGSGFGGNETWTAGGYFGNLGTFFADVTGDGRADAIALSNDAITVRRSSGVAFLANEAWTSNPYFGTRSTLFADVNGDNKADAVAVNDDGVYVRLSNGAGFTLPAVKWLTFASGSPSFGTVGVYPSSL